MKNIIAIKEITMAPFLARSFIGKNGAGNFFMKIFSATGEFISGSEF